MNKLLSIAVIMLACATLIVQLYGMPKISCSRMRTLTVASFSFLLFLIAVSEFYDTVTTPPRL